jgi:Zn-finger nucleic acid-binding protein
MQCPIDSTTLVMSERNGIEIDYCPQCRGVWLDRGELDKIIERAATPAGSRADRRSDDDPRYDRRRRDDDDDEGGIAGFLGNLFG